MSDVCLILEGTYPFVSGGVSTWIHQLITTMSDVRFSVLHISAYPNPRREYKYKLPRNLVSIQDLYLHDRIPDEGLSPAPFRRQALARFEALQEEVIAGRLDALPKLLELIRGPGRCLTFSDIFKSPEAWDILVRSYERHGEGSSFLDFFWTWRSVYLPLLKTLRCPIPKARLYHTVSTGYAGVLAATARITMSSAMVLTEHGVYTHERLLEISQSTWIYTPQRERFRVQRELSFFKRFWLGFFQLMGRITYENSDSILTLYEGNRVRQILAGAPAAKISIIPNGIDIRAYREIPLKTPASGPRTVAFIGRVVPIKDVKTFVQAAKVVISRLPGTRFLIVGPTDEEPEYAEECRALAKALGVSDSVRFAGKANMREMYPQVDLVVLTSLSEAQPYVILEANAVGLPVVATDVGACRELLEGRAPEDKELGPSGVLTPVSSPEETAGAIVGLLSDPGRWNAMSEAGRARTERFYDQSDLISRYLNLYEQLMR